MNNPINTIDQFGLDTTNVNNLDKDKWKKFNTKNDVVGLAEVNVSFNKGEAKAAAAYNTILGEVQENYKNGVGWRFQGYPDNLQYKAAERFYEKYYAHNEIDPFNGRPRVIGLEDANWIIDLAAGGIVSLVRTGAAVSASQAGGRVFWSGGQAAKVAAADFAAENGMKTLEMTLRGRIMNTVSPMLPRSMSSPIWNNLSRGFAQGASGEAHFFTTPLGPRSGSIWLNIEKPILQNNGVNIITH